MNENEGEAKGMLALIASMREELILLDRFEKLASEKRACFDVELHKYKDNEIVSVVCGTGKASSAAATQTIISFYHPDIVINVGTAGSIRDFVKSKDVVIGVDAVQHDFDVSEFGYSRSELPELGIVGVPCDEAFLSAAHKADLSDIRAHFGRMLTGDVIVTADYVKKANLDEFDALSADMESAAVGMICLMNATPFASLRCISDEGDEDRVLQFRENLGSVAEINGEVLTRILQEYLS
jgi:adenosylhomocysteine nucleosidase